MVDLGQIYIVSHLRINTGWYTDALVIFSVDSVIFHLHGWK